MRFVRDLAVPVVVVFGLLATVVACARPPGDPPLAMSAVPEPPVYVSPTCPTDVSSKPAVGPVSGGVPADFRVAWVLRCRPDVRLVPGHGRWSVVAVERADTDAAGLVAQLRQASEPPSNAVCTAQLLIIPYFVLVDAAGRAIRPSVPMDGCSKPRVAVRKVLDALPFHTLSVVQVRQIDSQAAIDAGCAQSWADLLADGPAGSRPTAPGPRPTAVGAIRVCVYRVALGGARPSGQFDSGHAIVGDAAVRLVNALDHAGVASQCADRHTRFAVLTGTDRAGNWGFVELDGCRRLLRADGSLRQPDPGTIVELARAP